MRSILGRYFIFKTMERCILKTTICLNTFEQSAPALELKPLTKKATPAAIQDP